jgi:membrane protein DedA with SNARE-associated domain
MSEAIQGALQSFPWVGLLLVALMAWAEYAFPPAPGDSTILFACFLAGTGALSLAAVAASALAGSVSGALTAWALGRRLGRSYFILRSEWARFELARLERGLWRYGPALLVANRFLPGVRGFFLYAAGIGRLGWRPVLLYSTLSNVMWIALIGWAGTGLGASWGEVRAVFRHYVWGIAIVLLLYAVLSITWHRRRVAKVAGSLNPSS